MEATVLPHPPPNGGDKPLAQCFYSERRKGEVEGEGNWGFSLLYLESLSGFSGGICEFR